MKDKYILDMTAGIRSIWIQKNHPNCLYIDIRREPKGFVAYRKNREIQPDMQMDFRDLSPLGDKKFKLIVWDPPHIIGKPSKTDCITATYGVLNKDTWKDDLAKGFHEAWKHLEDYGVLILKFNSFSINFKDVLYLFPFEPLFGTTSNNRKNSITRWFCYMKFPEVDDGLTEDDCQGCMELLSRCKCD